MNLFNPSTEILSLAGLATGLAGLFLSLYLLYKYNKQQQQLTKIKQQFLALSTTNENLIDQIRNSVKPNFIPAGIIINDSMNRIDIKLQNLGAAAIIEKVVTSTPDIEFVDDRFFPLRLETDAYFIVTGISKGLPLTECRYVVQLHYADIYHNNYVTVVRGEGQDAQLKTSLKG
jgi:hypothetical protein